MKNYPLNLLERLENIIRQLEIALNSPHSEKAILEEVIKQLNWIVENSKEII